MYVYLSSLCKGKTNTLKGEPFRPVRAIPVDLFPHTPHCELVIVLERNSLNTVISTEPESKPEPELKVKLEPELEVKLESEPEVKLELELEVKLESELEVKLESEREVKLEPEPEQQPSTNH